MANNLTFENKVKSFLIGAFFALGFGGIALEYNHVSRVTATVRSINTQQHTQGDKDGFRTSYKYIVATDKGVFEIKPDGLMATDQFGTLKEGARYRFCLRGYSIPFIGLYPYVMSAIEMED